MSPLAGPLASRPTGRNPAALARSRPGRDATHPPLLVLLSTKGQP